MEKELQNKLFEKYPKILTEVTIDTGDGWYWLIDNLCDQLQREIDNVVSNYSHFKENAQKRPQIIAVQVKEKFGRLRFYVRSAADEQYAIIDFAESLSFVICENCGSLENIEQTKKGRIQSLCDKCGKNKKS